MKRIIDLVFAFFGLVALSPVMLLVAVLVKTTSPGPILYCGRRVGRHGKDFSIFKYRSMVADAESLGGSSTANGDNRITPVGRFIRRFKIDELPQLFNVLRGEMSLVGPRPEVRDYIDLYTEKEMPILAVRPGITDWASIWNSDEGSILAGSDDPDRMYLEVIRPTKLQLQLLYVRNESVWTDIKIIFYTLYKLANKRFVAPELRPYQTLVASTKQLSSSDGGRSDAADPPGSRAA